MRILADSNMAAVQALFADLGEVRLLPGREIVADDLADVDVLLVRSVTQVNADLLSQHRPLFVGTATAGFDHVDRTLLSEAGIAFAHAPGSNANSVVEYVLAAIAATGDTLEHLMRGDIELGIIGYGHVGSLLSQRCQGLGMTIRAYDPWLDQQAHPELVALERVLACPVVCLHAALTEEHPWPSRHILNRQRLQQLAGSRLLLNAGRGPLIDNAALGGLLGEHPDWPVVLDVWEFEPEVDTELMAKCRIATPHIAGYSQDSKVLATRMLRDALLSSLQLEMQATETDVLPLLPVTVPTDLSGASLLRWLLGQVYDIGKDDARMRAELDQGFDRLRATYPVRRELASLLISNAVELSDESTGMLLALSCRVEPLC